MRSDNYEAITPANYLELIAGIKSSTLQGAVVWEAVAADVQRQTYMLTAFPLRWHDHIPLSGPYASRSCERGDPLIEPLSHSGQAALILRWLQAVLAGSTLWSWIFTVGCFQFVFQCDVASNT